MDVVKSKQVRQTAKYWIQILVSPWGVDRIGETVCRELVLWRRHYCADSPQPSGKNGATVIMEHWFKVNLKAFYHPHLMSFLIYTSHLIQTYNVAFGVCGLKECHQFK